MSHFTLNILIFTLSLITLLYFRLLQESKAAFVYFSFISLISTFSLAKISSFLFNIIPNQVYMSEFSAMNR